MLGLATRMAGLHVHPWLALGCTFSKGHTTFFGLLVSLATYPKVWMPDKFYFKHFILRRLKIHMQLWKIILRDLVYPSPSLS